MRHLERSRFLQAERKISRAATLLVGSREIPRPAGESAGLRNDAVVETRKFKLSPLPEMENRNGCLPKSSPSY
jgi:hypothetical protein